MCVHYAQLKRRKLEWIKGSNFHDTGTSLIFFWSFGGQFFFWVGVIYQKRGEGAA